MARILIIGASGGIGLQAVHVALERGHAVRALARRADRIGPGHPALEAVSADARDEAAIAATLEGIDAVILTVGLAAGPARMCGPVRLFSEAGRAVTGAMGRSGVRRLVAVTGFGAGESRRALSTPERLAQRMFLGAAYDDKDRQEAIIRDSELDWLILRPTLLTNGPGRGRCRILLEPESWRNGLIPRRDVADIAVREAASPTLFRVAPVLTC